MNNITITGNLTKEPELRFTNTGTPLCSFTIASNQGKDKEALFIDCDVWNEDITESVAELSKGTRVTVAGFLKQDHWEKDGQKFSKLKITAQDVAVSCRWQKVSAERIKKE
jgi:single-strand DNA-binding protein